MEDLPSILLAHSDLKRRRIPPRFLAPAPFPLLWRLGIPLRPPLFLEPWVASGIITSLLLPFSAVCGAVAMGSIIGAGLGFFVYTLAIDA